MRRGQFLQSLAAAAAPAPRAAKKIRVQYDAADHRNVPLPPAEWLRYLFEFPDQPNSQIGSIAWDLSLGDTYAVYPSRLLPPSPDRQLSKWRAEGFEWVQAILAECRKRNLEVIWHHRFSEVDIRPDGGLEMERRSPLKAAHPDWLIRSWWWQGLWNIASPGLRRHKLELLTEVAQTLDIDGIQIDFARHVPCLPPGRQWELRHHATTFLRDLRRALKPRHKLFVKVPETLAGCREDGFDLAAWAAENLVDGLTLGSRTMTVNVEEIRRAVGPKVHLSPCIDDHHATDGYRYPPIEFFRGVATNWLNQGADSVTTFNWAAGPATAPAGQTAAYSEIGSLAAMRHKPKLFTVERRGGYPWAEGYFNRNDHLPLPARLANHGRPSQFPLRVYEREIPSAELSVILFNARPEDQLAVSCNGHVLVKPRIESWKDPQIFSPKPQPNSGGKGEYKVDPAQRLLRQSFAVPPQYLKPGENQIAIAVLDRPAFKIGEDVQVEKIELSLTSQTNPG